MMRYQVEIKSVEAMRVAYTKYKGEVKRANKVFPSVFKAIRGNSNGAPFFTYYSMNLETKEGELELCVPTEAEPEIKGIEVKVMPRVKALSVTHIGPYETLGEAYATLQTYALQNGIRLVLPYREVYIKGPGMMLRGNPEKYITEILYPIEEA